MVISQKVSFADRLFGFAAVAGAPQKRGAQGHDARGGHGSAPPGEGHYGPQPHPGEAGV